MALIQRTGWETKRSRIDLDAAVNLMMILETERRSLDLVTDAVRLMWSWLIRLNSGVYLEPPCLIFSQNSSNSWKIFRSWFNDFYISDFPELEDAEIHFSRDGWLLMGVDECPLFFFNPCTRAKLVLPPTPSSFMSVCFTSPPTSSSCCVFGLLCDSTSVEFQYGFIEFGNHEWRLGRWESRHFFSISNCPPLFCNGVYYLLDSLSTSIAEFDPAKEDEYRWKHYFLIHLNPDEDNEGEQEENGEEEVEEDDKKKDEDEDDKNDEEEDEELEVGVEVEEDFEDEDIVHEEYMVEVEGEIWAVFLKNITGNVRVEKLDLLEMQWKRLDSLGGKCLYLSNKGSFAESCLDIDMANKIYFDRFYGKNGIVYCMKSKMYYSVGGDFASKEVAGNTISNKIYGPGLTQPYNGTWFEPRRN